MRLDESWYHIYSNEVSSAYQLSGLLQKQALAMAAIRPGVSVFSRLDRETGGTHFYFPPEMNALAVQHGASPCQKPSKQEVGGLLFGDHALPDRFHQ